MNELPKTWKEWEKKYQNVIKHTRYEWDFAKDVLPHVVDLQPSQVIPQHVFINTDGYKCHMDFAVIVDNVKIAIELEGFDKTNSGRGPTKEEHGRFILRQQALTSGGWKSFPITNAQFKRDSMFYALAIRRMILEGSDPHSESVAKTPNPPPVNNKTESVATTPNPPPVNNKTESVATAPNPPPVNNQNKQQLFIVSAIVLGLLAAIILLLTRTAPSEVAKTTAGALPVVNYKNCDALKEVYSGGIARSVADKERKQFSDPIVNKSVYDANEQLDGNSDGVMCDSTAGALPVVNYKNCDALKEVYPGGIARSVADKERKQFSDPIVNKSVYDGNEQLDGNLDGVMCDS